MAWTDLEILNILDLHERQGWTADKIAQRLGTTSSAILGLIFRIRKDSDKHRCACSRPENRNGGMPARWWEGAAKRRRK